MNLIWIAQIVLLVGIAWAILYKVRGSRRVRPLTVHTRLTPKTTAPNSPDTLLQGLSPNRRETRHPPRI